MTEPNESGFTLVEIMVAVFILGISVIGIAAMQLHALRTTQQSAFQSTAIELASEIANRMRANTHQMKLVDSLNPFLHLDFQSATHTAMPPRVSCYTSDCDAAELAQFDIHEWKRRIKAELPGGRIRICRDASPWDSAAGAFRWACSSPGNAENNTSLVVKIGWQGKGFAPDGSLLKGNSKHFPPSVAVTVEPTPN
ncbi:MAG: type IV pilus modification protein PilV [Pseudomonadota bacterium]